MIDNDVKQQLVEIYRLKKGKSGSLKNILSCYHNDIVNLHQRNYSVFMIVKHIEKDLDFCFFDQDKDNNPLMRSVRDYLKKIKKENAYEVVEEPEPSPVKVRTFQRDEKSEVSEKPKRENRSSLTGVSDATNEAKDAIQRKDKQ